MLDIARRALAKGTELGRPGRIGPRRRIKPASAAIRLQQDLSVLRNPARVAHGESDRRFRYIRPTSPGFLDWIELPALANSQHGTLPTVANKWPYPYRPRHGAPNDPVVVMGRERCAVPG